MKIHKSYEPSRRNYFEYMKLRVCTMFSGYDSQCMALDRLKEKYPEFDYELVAWAEIDKYAIQAHNAVYPQWADRNYGDVSKIDWNQVPDFDLLTYSSPCQDFSNAGKQAGGAEGSGTRSSLLWEVRRAILAKKPKYLLMENVAALVSQKFIGTFNQWQLELERYGYTNFSQVLNAKDYGVPQNRERIFMVSILDCDAPYYFPKPFPLTKRLKDVLEENVGEEYYLSEKAINCFTRHAERQGGEGKNFAWRPTDGDVVASCLEAKSTNRPKDNYIKTIGEINKGLSGKVYDEEGLCHTITASEGVKYNTKIVEPQVMTQKRTEYGKQVRKQYESHQLEAQRKNLQQQDNYVCIPTATKDGVQMMELGGVCDLSYPNSETRRGRVQEGGTVAPTLTCGVENALRQIDHEYRIRKLTERECFRLMGVRDEDSDKFRAAVSKSQCYKLAGNSIVVDVMVVIF